MNSFIRCGYFVAATILLATGPAPNVMAQTDAPTVLITGSNRDIGFAFVKGYAERGWTVIATCRTPSQADDLNTYAAEHDNVLVEQLDIVDPQEISALAEKYRGTPIDVLLNNAAINPFPFGQSQRFGEIDYDQFKKVLEVNVLGPLRVSEAFLDNVKASDKKTIVAMTSNGGSIGRADMSVAPDYRSSKAALNMTMRLLALELADQQVKVGILAPGSVDTAGFLDADPATLPENIQRQIAMSPRALVPPEKAIGLMIDLIDGLTLETSGVFYDLWSEVWPW